jgi:hypothetical protein
MTKKQGMGFGDFIRGTIATRQLCFDYNIPFSMDFRLHPINIYLENQCLLDLPCVKDIYDIQDIPNFTSRALLANLKSKVNLKSLHDQDLHIYTNVWPTFRRSKIITESIKHHLIPTVECEEAIADAMGSLINYEVIHIRSGDLLSFNTQIGDTVNYTLDQIINSVSEIQQIIDNAKYPCIVLSDSNECKRILSERYGLYCTHTQSAHLALTTQTSSVLNTLIDFFILSRAKHIHQFSVHHWGSGFSDSAHRLYSVPITKYRLSPAN